MEGERQKFSIHEEFKKRIIKEKIKYIGRNRNGVDIVEEKGVNLVKEFYQKAVFRNQKGYYLAMICLTGKPEHLQWAKERINELQNKVCYMHPSLDRDLMPIDYAICADKPSEEYLKEGFILATEDTFLTHSFIIECIAAEALNIYANDFYNKDFFWELLNERVIGTMNVIYEMIRNKYPNILTFCRNILKNSKNESDHYKSTCYVILRDKNLKQDTELLIDFIKRDMENCSLSLQKTREETLVKLQKKLENNKAKQK